MKKFFQNKKGFTLMEMVVVLAIFVISISMITETFILVARAQRRIMVEEIVYSNASYALNLMAQYIRVDTIDYNSYPSVPLSSPSQVLHLISNDGTDTKTAFKLCDTSVDTCSCPSGVTRCLLMSIDGGATWQSVTPKGIEVKKLEFYPAPLTDPFVVGGPNVQPRVTIVLELANNKDLSSSYQTDLSLQSTISSRVYLR